MLTVAQLCNPRGGVNWISKNLKLIYSYEDFITISRINVESEIYARCRSWMQECKKIRKFKRRVSKHNTNKKIYSSSVPTLHLRPLSKLLLENSNPLNRIQQEYNVGTSDSSYPKLEYLFFEYKPTQYNPIQGSDQPFHILESFQN